LILAFFLLKNVDLVTYDKGCDKECDQTDFIHIRQERKNIHNIILTKN